MAGRFDNNRGPPSKRARMDGDRGFGGQGGGFGNGGGRYGGGGYAEGGAGGYGGGGYGGNGGGGGGGMGGGGVGAAMSHQQVDDELNRIDQNIRPNHILLCTVLNAQYPIDVQIIAKVGRCVVVAQLMKAKTCLVLQIGGENLPR